REGDRDRYLAGLLSNPSLHVPDSPLWFPRTAAATAVLRLRFLRLAWKADQAPIRWSRRRNSSVPDVGPGATPIPTTGSRLPRLVAPKSNKHSIHPILRTGFE